MYHQKGYFKSVILRKRQNCDKCGTFCKNLWYLLLESLKTKCVFRPLELIESVSHVKATVCYSSAKVNEIMCCNVGSSDHWNFSHKKRGNICWASSRKVQSRPQFNFKELKKVHNLTVLKQPKKYKSEQCNILDKTEIQNVYFAVWDFWALSSGFIGPPPLKKFCSIVRLLPIVDISSWIISKIQCLCENI